MGALFQSIIGWVMASNLAKFFTGVGVAVVSHAVITGFIDDALQSITSTANNASADVLALFLMLGFGQFLSIIGTAALTRASIQAASKSFGITTQT